MTILIFGAKMARYHYLAKKIRNLPLFWKYVRIYHFFETRVCRKTRASSKNLSSLKKYTSNFQNFSMILEFHELKYHGKLNFAKLEYPKSDKSLHIFETVVVWQIATQFTKRCYLAIFAHIWRRILVTKLYFVANYKHSATIYILCFLM